jgi:hypothetical protein
MRWERQTRIDYIKRYMEFFKLQCDQSTLDRQINKALDNAETHRTNGSYDALLTSDWALQTAAYIEEALVLEKEKDHERNTGTGQSDSSE